MVKENPYCLGRQKIMFSQNRLTFALLRIKITSDI